MEKVKSLTENQKAQLCTWKEKWIANAMSCKPMDKEEKDIMRDSISNMYRIAGLNAPKKIVFVPSPFVGQIAAGIACALIGKKESASVCDSVAASVAASVRDSVDASVRASVAASVDASVGDSVRDSVDASVGDSVRASVDASVGDSVYDSVRASVAASVDASVGDSVRDSVDASVAASVRDSVDASVRASVAASVGASVAASVDASVRDSVDASVDASVRASVDASVAASVAASVNDSVADKKQKGKSAFNISPDLIMSINARFNLGKFGLLCMQEAWRLRNGGNLWSGWASFLTFFRDIVKLDVDFSKLKYWENATIHGGYRFLHKDFAMISDRPIFIKNDEQGRAHCFDGPFVKWRDGSEIYRIHGIAVPQWVVYTKPEEFTKEMILNEQNADVRRCIIQKIGYERLVQLIDYKTLDTLKEYELINIEMGDKRMRPFLKFPCTSSGAWHVQGVLPNIDSCEKALCYKYAQDKYKLEIWSDERFNGGNISDYEFGQTVQRHGDVHLKKWDAFKIESPTIARAILHAGQNNNHELNGGTFQIFENEQGKFLNVIEQTNFEHNEHGNPPVAVGFYKVHIDLEYDHLLEESRQVRD